MFDFLKSPKSRLSGKRRREDDVLGRTNDASERSRSSRTRAIQRDANTDAAVKPRSSTSPFSLPRK